MTSGQQTRNARPQADGAAVGGLRAGLVGGLLASVCCLPPALSLVLGVAAGSAFFSSLSAHETFFQLAGLGLTLVAAIWAFRRRARSSGSYRNELPSLVVSMSTFVGASLTITYVITPFLYYLYGHM